MFRAGNLKHIVALVTTKGSCPFLYRQGRYVQLWSYVQQALATRSMGVPSATARVVGGGKQKQPIEPQTAANSDIVSKTNWPRKIFSGIQPTGSLHLGNYLGAVRRWVQLQNAHDDVTVSIVDMHSITMPQNPPMLRENIFIMAATLLACGIDPGKSTLFVQSAIPEHSEFNFILSSLTTMSRVAQLPQFREKSRLLKDIPLGLYVYPVLQAADIMLYKATHVPVGADQLQHIQLAQHLARTYNDRYGETFPVCEALIENGETSRVLSLRDPSSKMSKTDGNIQATINLTDSPELIAQKINNAVTDFNSDIAFEPSKRPGVSNLVNIHAQVTGQTVKSVVDEATALDTAKYKERVTEAVIEHLSPIREQIHHHLSRRNEMIYLLEMGATKARQQAQHTLSDVKQRLGLGSGVNMPPAIEMAPVLPPELSKTSASRMMSGDFDANAHERHKRMYGVANPPSGGGQQSDTGEPLPEGIPQPTVRRAVRRPPVVPSQSLRVEKQQRNTQPRYVFRMDCGNAPHIAFKLPKKMATNFVTKEKRQTSDSRGAFNYGQSGHAIPSAVSMIFREVNAPKKQEFTCNLANSGFYPSPFNEGVEKSEDVIIVPEEKQTSAVERDEKSEEESEWENAEQSAPEQTKV